MQVMNKIEKGKVFRFTKYSNEYTPLRFKTEKLI